MAEKVHDFTKTVAGSDGAHYRARAYAEKRGNVWIGWIEFLPSGGSGESLRTGEETSQPDRDAVEYWASGLEPVYLEGALRRAVPTQIIASQ